MIHRLLARQLLRLGLDEAAPPGDEAWRTLLGRVSRAYEEADQGRYLMERSITISGREMRELNEELLLRGAEQAALRRVATRVAAEREPEGVLPLLAEEVARLQGAECGLVIRFEEGGRGRVMGFWAEPELAIQTPGEYGLSDTTAAGRVRASGLPARAYAPPGHVDRPIVSVALRVSVAAPIRVESAVWGAVVAASIDADRFAEGAETKLQSFAELAALAIANAEAHAMLAARASTDHLTGLANHRTFHEHLASEVDRARRHGRRLALALFDIDHFKPINDRYGHQVGDRVLVEVARRLDACARPSDLVARVGGEEFAWLLPESDGLDGWEAAERARQAIAREPFADVGTITLSGGVCDLAQASDGADLYRLADGALYWAKAHGRDVCFRYSPDVVEVLSANEQAERLERQQALTSVRVLARVVDAKDSSTRRHSERVAELAVRIATALGWHVGRLAQLHDAGLVHDVGKIGIPDRILLKPGRLTAEEYEEIKGHAALGAQMLDDVFSDEQVSWVRSHHERHDGRGYPDGLAGDAIPDGARVLAVADAWDVMTTARAYSPPISWEDALVECRRCSGAQFAPDVVEALERVIAAGAHQVVSATD